ncbi:hypothetical protein QR680_003353 [Steinernema hermaphroditum]|uniref:Clc-like protein 2 n=1 Tax=Steinernema hermaphroditum TaxID=289476 RepID=A0AA39H8Z7_9BILA|nr:hypothetical protein QR680_003353 [Steinernema hermaphroditum]
MTGLQLNTDFRHDLRQSFDNSEETMFLHMPYFVKRAMNGVMIADECIVKGALSENTMRTAISVSRLILVLLTTLLIIAGIVISLVAIGTPAWQVVNITEFHTEHQHGLWLDCTIGRKHVQGSSDSSLHCTYKFENPTGENDPYNIQGIEEQHKFFKWHKAVLGFFVISVLTALISLCFTLCSPCVRICAVVANVLSLITVSLTVVAMVVYFINSHKVEVRFVHGITRTYEQSRGYSFWLGITAALAHLVAFIFGVISTILIFLHDRQQHRSPKMWYKHNTSV